MGPKREEEASDADVTITVVVKYDDGRTFQEALSAFDLWEFESEYSTDEHPMSAIAALTGARSGGQPQLTHVFDLAFRAARSAREHERHPGTIKADLRGFIRALGTNIPKFDIEGDAEAAVPLDDETP